MTMDETGQTIKECQRKHRFVAILQWGIVALLVLFMAAATWAVGAGQMARDLSTRVDNRITTHEAKQTERDIRIEASLLRLETELAKQRQMVEDIWKQQKP